MFKHLPGQHATRQHWYLAACTAKEAASEDGKHPKQFQVTYKAARLLQLGLGLKGRAQGACSHPACIGQSCSGLRLCCCPCF